MYEHLIAQHFRQRGYQVQVTQQSNDYGLDVLAQNQHERIAIQAKLYGHTSRPVNRQMMMELHGVKDYFNCTHAVMATDGSIRPDAREVAQKLGITILELSADSLGHELLAELERKPACDSVSLAPKPHSLRFDTIWIEHIMPLAGNTITADSGRTNHIVSVDWSGVKRVSSSGRLSSIDIEIFRLAVNRILEEGSITREEINQNYSKRASSAIVLVLSQVPFFQFERHPTIRLRYIPPTQ